MRRIIFGLSLLAALLASAPAPAQNTTGLTVATCGSPPTAFTATRPGPFTVDTGGQLCITGSISASLSGFAPATQGTPVAATTGGNTQTLPVGAVVVATNIGTTNAAYCRLGAAATTDSQYIAPNGGWFAFTVGANTQLTCVTSTSTTTVNTAGGAGLPTGTGGGGGSGGGGGGAITAASGSYASGALSSGSVASGAYASGSIGSGAMVDLGAIADAAATTGSTGTLSAKARLMTTQLNTLNTTLGSPFQAGASIGNTTFAATQATSSNLKAQVDPLTAASWGIGTATQNSASVANGQLALAQFNTTPTTITTGNMSPLQLDNAGKLLVNCTGCSSSSAITSWGGGTLGAMANYGTSPGAVLVPGMNAFVTNSNANGSAVSASSSPVVIASDQAAVATKAASTAFASGSLVDVTNMSAATAAAPPAKAIYLGANASGATGGLLAGLVQCDNKAVYDASTNGSTELQALTSGRSIYVCGYTIMAGGTVNVKLIYGTGTACATGSNNLTPAYQLTAQAGVSDPSPFYRGMKTASANALCINTSAGVAAQAIVYYAII